MADQPRVRCPRCGASWPVSTLPASCPVCASDHGGGRHDPNAGGSPSPVEAEEERLLRQQHDERAGG